MAIVPLRRLPTPDGTRTYDKARAGPREETTPRLKLTSASEQTLPRPSIASASILSTKGARRHQKQWS
jgi:hypothetical protein